MDRSKKMIFGVVAAVVVLVVVGLVVWPSKKACTPSKDKPDLNSLKAQNVGSSDDSTLASLLGYVELLPDKSYLPVDLKSVSISKAQPGAKPDMTVVMTGTCVSFELTVNKVQGQYAYTGLHMSVKNDAKDSSFKAIGDFAEKFEFQGQPAQSRYSCLLEQSHSCVAPAEGKNATQVANLVLKSFELELERDATSAKQGEFAKPQWQTSCESWDK